MHVDVTCVTSVFNCTCLFVCLFVCSFLCKRQQFYMNHKILITVLYGLAYHFAGL